MLPSFIFITGSTSVIRRYSSNINVSFLPENGLNNTLSPSFSSLQSFPALTTLPVGGSISSRLCMPGWPVICFPEAVTRPPVVTIS